MVQSLKQKKGNLQADYTTMGCSLHECNERSQPTRVSSKPGKPAKRHSTNNAFDAPTFSTTASPFSLFMSKTLAAQDMA